MRELREDIRIGVEESQNLTRGLHAEAMDAVNGLRAETMQAISSLDAVVRRDVVSRLERLLESRRPDAGGE